MSGQHPIPYFGANNMEGYTKADLDQLNATLQEELAARGLVVLPASKSSPYNREAAENIDMLAKWVRLEFDIEFAARAAATIGRRGGTARAAKLTAEQRSQIARQGGLAGGRGRRKEPAIREIKSRMVLSFIEAAFKDCEGDSRKQCLARASRLIRRSEHFDPIHIVEGKAAAVMAGVITQDEAATL